MTNTARLTTTGPNPARHTLITLQIAVHDALEVWDSVMLQTDRAGALQDAIEAMRVALQNYSLTTNYAIQVTSKYGPRWLFTHDGTHCVTKDVSECDRYDTADLAEQFAAQLRSNYPGRTIAVRAVAKLDEELV